MRAGGFGTALLAKGDNRPVRLIRLDHLFESKLEDAGQFEQGSWARKIFPYKSFQSEIKYFQVLEGFCTLKAEDETVPRLVN